MKSLTSLDIYFVRQELMSLIDAKIDKIYQPDENTIILQLHKEGKRILKIILPGLIFISTTKSAGDQLNFSRFLRKQLANYRLKNIEQKNFERILELEFANKDKKIMIIELFSKGNVILCDQDYKIISALKVQSWKDRTIKPNEKYLYPPSASSRFNSNLGEFAEMLKISNKESIVKTLAIDFSFGGVYAEEICFRAGIDKKSKPSSDSEIQSIYNIIQEIKKSGISANMSKNDAFPFELKSRDSAGIKYFSSFSEALEIAQEQPMERINKEMERLTKLLDTQKKQLENIRKSIDEESEKGTLIYKNYQLVSSLLQKKDLDKLKDDNLVNGINKKEKTFAISIENKDITLNINDSIDRNASIYYEKAKKMKHKLAGAEKAINATMEKLKKTDVIEAKKEKTIEIKREWYEKFRWFISSDGILIIAGRDATTNDIIIKKHLEKNDLVFHTDMRGSPFVVIKPGSRNIGRQTIEETAVFCASNSKQWSAKLATSDVYYIGPEQVKKEFGLPKGSFMIHGKRTYLKPILELAIGVTKDNKIMCAPQSAVKSNCKTIIVIKQGDVKKSDIAKKIKKRFDEQLKIKINLDEIMQSLPPGDCSIG